MVFGWPRLSGMCVYISYSSRCCRLAATAQKFQKCSTQKTSQLLSGSTRLFVPEQMMRIFAWSLQWEKISKIFAIRETFPYSFLFQQHFPRSRMKNIQFGKRISEKKLGFKFLWMIKCDDWTVDSWKCSDFSELLSWTTHRWPKRKRKNREKKKPKNKHFFPFFHSGRRRSDTTLAMPANVECLSVERKWREIKNLECKFFYGFYNKLRLLPSSLALALAIRVELQQSLIFLFFAPRARFYFPSAKNICCFQLLLHLREFYIAQKMCCQSSMLWNRNGGKKHNRHTEKKRRRAIIKTRRQS